MNRIFSLMICSTFLVGCSSEVTNQSNDPQWVVAYDVKSKETVLVDASIQLPITNPENVKSKLQPAMYCERCQKWYPTPPLEQLNRTPGAAVCPKGQGPLSPTGPLPEKKLDLLKGEST